MTEAPSGIAGADVPDRRGRTGLHLTGLRLERNPRVRVRDVELVASAWHVLRTTTFDYLGDDGSWVSQSRETYDRGNGATVLLYDPTRRLAPRTAAVWPQRVRRSRSSNSASRTRSR